MSLITNSEFYYQNIRNKLTELCSLVAVDNSVNIQSLNIHAEGFYAEFLNCLFDWNLVNANVATQNAAGIDLIDAEKKIVVQVSSTNTRDKIKKSLSKSDKEEYSGYHFYFVAITTQTTNYRKFDVPVRLSFDKAQDVLNTPALLRHVLNAGIDKRKVLSELMDKYFNSGEKTTKGEYLTAPPPFADTNSVICREKELEEIQKMLQEKKSIVLMSGFGGIGKTALARLVFHSVRENYDEVAWIKYNGDMKSSMLASIQRFEANQDQNARWNQITSLKNDGKSKLFVIDNVDCDKKTGQEPQDDELLRKITGWPNTSIILTSRLEELDPYIVYKIDFLSKESCEKVFYQYYTGVTSSDQRKQVEKLIALAMNHTLTVELFAKGARRVSSFKDYCRKLQKSFSSADVNIRVAHNDQNATIKGHLKILFDLNKRSAKENAVLWDFAVLPTYAVISQDEAVLWFAHDSEILDQLAQEDWLSWSDDGYSMHPLVKEIIRLRPIPRGTAEHYLNFIQDYQNGFFQKNDRTTEMLRKLEIAESVLNVCEKHIDDLKRAHIIENIGWAYRRTGRFSAALSYYKRALSIKKKILKKDDPELAVSYNCLGRACREKADNEEALEWYQRALSIQEKETKGDHLDTAKTYNNIGRVYRDMGDFNQALEYYQKALTIRESVLGRKDRLTATTYTNIAGVYRGMGNIRQGLVYHQKALSIREKILGKEHPNTAATYSGIASLYQDAGMLQESFDMFKKVIAIQEGKLGIDHPYTAASYNNIALVCQKMGELDQAFEYYNKALSVFEKSFGKKHSYTAITYHNIGAFYYAKKEIGTAHQYFLNALKVWIKKLRPEHPTFINTLSWELLCFEVLHYEKEDFVCWMQKQLSKKECLVFMNRVERKLGNILDVH